MGDIGKGAFNTSNSTRGTIATTVDVAKPVIEVFRSLDQDDALSVAECQAKLAVIVTAEKEIFSHYPALVAFAANP